MFGRGISLFTLAGFEVKLDWSWTFIALSDLMKLLSLRLDLEGSR